MNYESEYRAILKNEFFRIAQINKSFSQRAFAKMIGLSTAHVNAIFRGRKGLSPVAAELISSKLKFSKEKKELFCDLVILCSKKKISKTDSTTRLKRKKNQDCSTLNDDKFEFISNWYHLAILELSLLDNEKISKVSVSQKFKITEEEADKAIKLLIKLQLLKEENNKLVAVENETFTCDDIPSQNIKKAHHQMLCKAINALASQTCEKRDFTSTIVSVDTKNLHLAKKAIRDFSDKFMLDFCSSSEIKNDVFTLNIQFFSLTK